MRDPVDIDLREHENRCEESDNSSDQANAADTANDDAAAERLPSPEAQDRMIAAIKAARIDAHRERTLNEMSGWVLGRSRPANPAKGDV